MGNDDNTEIDYSELRRGTWASAATLVVTALVAMVFFLLVTQASVAFGPRAFLTISCVIAWLIPMQFLLVSGMVSLNYLFRPAFVVRSGILRKFVIRELIRGNKPSRHM